MPTYFSLSCQHCNSEFKVISRDRNRKFCSAVCAKESKRKPRELNCIKCGNKLTGKYQLKFCSNSCAASYNNKGVRRHGNPPSFCKICGNQTGSYKHIYCSNECKVIGQTVYTGDLKLERIKQKNRIAQHKWRAKYNRKLSLTANSELVSYIIKNCPSGWEVDHIIPLSKGGEHHENNLQYLPAEENRTKGHRLIYSAVNREYDVRKVIKEFLELEKNVLSGPGQI